jgi:hypothetical protein
VFNPNIKVIKFVFLKTTLLLKWGKNNRILEEKDGALSWPDDLDSVQ